MDEHDGELAAGLHQRAGHRLRLNQHDIRSGSQHSGDGVAAALRIAYRPLHVDGKAIAFTPAVRRQGLLEGGEACGVLRRLRYREQDGNAARLGGPGAQDGQRQGGSPAKQQSSSHEITPLSPSKRAEGYPIRALMRKRGPRRQD
jgi:hypothetical protein